MTDRPAQGDGGSAGAPAPTAASRRPAGAVRAWLVVLGWVWALTLVASLATATITPLAHATRELLELRLVAATNPPPSLGRVVAIAAHNIQTAGWPLLLPVLGAQRRAWSRTLADAAVIAGVVVNALLVGAALGSYQARLLPYLPQLPLEWGAVAIAPAQWWLSRRGNDGGSNRWSAAATLVLTLAAAALVETFCVPHR